MWSKRLPYFLRFFLYLPLIIFNVKIKRIWPYPAGSKKIEKDRNCEIGKDRTLLSLPIHHFASLKLYLFLYPHLSRVTWNIYLFLSLCLVISIFSYPLVYSPNEVVSIFFSSFRDRPLVSFSTPHYVGEDYYFIDDKT